MRVAFLLHNAYALGGTVRTTFTLAQALAARHDVELVSVFRHRTRPRFADAAASGLTPKVLVDGRPGSADLDHPRRREPARYFPKGDSTFDRYHRLAEERILDWFASTEADVVISTRAGLNVLLGHFGPRHAVRIAQEHLTHDTHGHRLRRDLQRAYRSLDALVTVTEADARDHRRKMRLPADRIVAIPNGVPAPQVAPSEGESETIVTAGRLARLKRFPMLVDAFARVAADFPGWTLRIYGHGREHDRIAARIRAHGLEERALLMGTADPMEAEWAKGALAAASSAHEPFGMTIAEAMRCGLPVVSTDCRHGPGEIITDGVDGRLVARDSVRELAAGLGELMGDRELRRRMSRAAVENAKRFEPDDIARRYEELAERLGRRGTDLAEGGTGLAARGTTAGASAPARSAPARTAAAVGTAAPASAVANSAAAPGTSGTATAPAEDTSVAHPPPRVGFRNRLAVTAATSGILVRGALRRVRRLAAGNRW